MKRISRVGVSLYFDLDKVTYRLDFCHPLVSSLCFCGEEHELTSPNSGWLHDCIFYWLVINKNLLTNNI